MQLSLLLALLPLVLALPAPIIVPREGAPIPGKYIVKMRNDLKTDSLDSLITAALKVIKKDPAHVYKFGTFGGFSAEMADDVVELLRNMHGVSRHIPEMHPASTKEF